MPVYLGENMKKLISVRRSAFSRKLVAEFVCMVVEQYQIQ
jgi:hypothetical protein